MNGARMNNLRSAAAGMMSSLTSNFRASATVCNRPHLPACNPGPCPIGPMRSCIKAETFRST